jgi:hypothetical protein
MSQMAVVGYDVEGNEVYGEVMGELDGDGVMGARRRRAGRQIAIPPKAQWRNQLAPGVIQPDEGMVPLTLVGQSGSPPGQFSSTLQTMTFQGQLQKPFRPERLLCSTVRTGVSAVGRLLTVLYVGTDLQQADINGWDAELVGLPGAFGTRLTCKAAEPGVLIRAVVTLSQALLTTDTIFANFTFMGRIIH